AHLRFRARKHEGQKSMLARDDAQRAGIIGGEQPLRLPHRDAWSEEDRDAPWSQEWRLLAYRVAIEAPRDSLSRLLCVIMQALDGRLRAPRQPASEPSKDISQT